MTAASEAASDASLTPSTEGFGSTLIVGGDGGDSCGVTTTNTTTAAAAVAAAHPARASMHFESSGVAATDAMAMAVSSLGMQQSLQRPVETSPAVSTNQCIHRVFLCFAVFLFSYNECNGNSGVVVGNATIARMAG
jgi:hypothetical protein